MMQGEHIGFFKYGLLLSIFFYLAIIISIEIFYPLLAYLPPGKNYEITSPYLLIGDKKDLAIVYLKNPDADKTIIFSHGNAENLALLMPYLKYLQKSGYQVISYDYTGYGKSTGWPSSAATLNNIEQVYHYTVNQLSIPPEKIVVWGRSIGSGPSLYLMSKYPVNAGVLEAPFYSLHQVITHVMLTPFDPYPNYKWIQKVQAPLLIIHGDNDQIISPWHSKQLSDECNNCQLWQIQDLGHNDLFLAPNYFQNIFTFINHPHTKSTLNHTS